MSFSDSNPHTGTVIDLNASPKEEEEIVDLNQVESQEMDVDQSEPHTGQMEDISQFVDGVKIMSVPEKTTQSSGATVGPIDWVTPEWLPEGWLVDFEVQSSGATAGPVDWYYVEPVSGRRFRSKKEVFHFIETGSKLKRKPNPDADAMSSESPGGHKQKKVGSKAKISAPPNFDFDNPPNEVSWALTNATTDTWTPFIGDEKVAESTKLEWDDAFEYLNTRKGDGTV